MRLWAGLALAWALGACAQKTATLPNAPIATGPAIRVVATPIAENADGTENLCLDAIPKPKHGPVPSCPNWSYAGGIALTSAETSRLHGLSDLDVQLDGRFTAVSDDGDLVTGRIVLTPDGALSGVADVALATLNDADGRQLSGRKADGDAEGLVRWPNGDLMVSFEGRNDILLYPAAGGPPRKVARPDSDFPSNDGMEALALDAASGPDAYLVGREDTRQTWTCRLAGSCTPRFVAPQHGRGKLTSARPMPGGGWVFLLRDFTPLAGSTIWIVITDRLGRETDVHEIKRPATVDNIEGVAPVPRKNGAVRLYLVSDDNFSSGQRTLLMAFDWRPRRGAKP